LSNIKGLFIQRKHQRTWLVRLYTSTTTNNSKKKNTIFNFEMLVFEKQRKNFCPISFIYMNYGPKRQKFNKNTKFNKNKKTKFSFKKWKKPFYKKGLRKNSKNITFKPIKA
jgi:hypothetical protein